MKIILKLINGDEIIGNLDDDTGSNCDFYNIVNPMLIVSEPEDYGGAMKLRDFFLLSDEEMLSVPSKHVIVSYKPSDSISEYYDKAVVYARTYTKTMTDEQIRRATAEIEDITTNKDQRSRDITELLMKLTKSSLQ